MKQANRARTVQHQKAVSNASRVSPVKVAAATAMAAATTAVVSAQKVAMHLKAHRPKNAA